MNFKSSAALAAAAIAATISLGSAQAAVVVTSVTTNALTGPANFPAATTIDFNGFVPGTAANFVVNGVTFASTPTTGGSVVEQGSTPYAYMAPTGDTTPYLALGGTTAFETNSETITLANAVSSLGFYWGSIDKYNTVSFYSGGTLINTISGTDVASFAGYTMPNGVNTNTSAFVNFHDTAGKFNEIVLSTTQPNFELDNITIGGVPETSTWAMMLIGFGSLALLYRRRQSLTGSTTAVAC